MRQSLEKIAKSYALPLFLCCLYPQLFYLSTNAFTLQRQEIIDPLWRICLECLPFLFIDIFAQFLPLKEKSRRILDALVIGIGVTVGGCLMHLATSYAFLQPFLSGYSFFPPGTIVICWLSLFFILPAIIGKKVYTTALLLLCAMAIGQWTVLETRQMMMKSSPPLGQALRFKKSPNVYLFFLESYSDLETIEQIYRIDTRDMRQYLASYAYTLYPPCFANYDCTLVSEASLLNMKHHWYKIAIGLNDMGRKFRREMGGENPVLHTFLANGYKTNCFLFLAGEIVPHGNSTFDFYGQIPRTHLDRLTNRRPADRCALWERILHACMWVVPSTTSFFKGEPFLPFHQATETVRTSFLNRLKIDKASPSPKFYFINTGAAHSAFTVDVNTWPDLFAKFETEQYPLIRREADNELIAMLTDIYRYDPDALVILIGDHGARRYRGIEKGEGEVNALIRSRGISPGLAARDAVGVFLAIKWPTSLQPWVQRFLAGKAISHVNLFRFIFAALTEDLSVLDDCEPNESYVPANGKRCTHG